MRAMTLRRLTGGALLPLFAAFLVSCADRGPLHPSVTGDVPAFSATFGATLLECPTEVERSTSAVLGPMGGRIELDGHRLELPIGAVRRPTNFRVTVPAGNYMQLSVTGDGQEHFRFHQRVSMTIDYSRCTRANIEKSPLVIYHVDRATKTLLTNMGGVDDKVARTVTIGTDHLSDYAIAVP